MTVKREYMKPSMTVVELDQTARLLIGSNPSAGMTVVYEGEENI